MVRAMRGFFAPGFFDTSYVSARAYVSLHEPADANA